MWSLETASLGIHSSSNTDTQVLNVKHAGVLSMSSLYSWGSSLSLCSSDSSLTLCTGGVARSTGVRMLEILHTLGSGGQTDVTQTLLSMTSVTAFRLLASSEFSFTRNKLCRLFFSLSDIRKKGVIVLFEHLTVRARLNRLWKRFNRDGTGIFVRSTTKHLSTEYKISSNLGKLWIV